MNKKEEVTEKSKEEITKNLEPEVEQAQGKNKISDLIDIPDGTAFELPDGFNSDEFLERFNHANFRVPNNRPEKNGYSYILSYATAFLFLLLYLCSDSKTAYANNFGSYYQIIQESKDEIVFLKTSAKEKHKIYKIKYQNATLEDLKERKQDNLFLPKDLIAEEEKYQIKIDGISDSKEIINIVKNNVSASYIAFTIYNFDGTIIVSTDKTLLFTSKECVFPGTRFYVYEDGTADAVFTAGNRLYHIKSDYPLNEFIKYINTMEVLY